MTNQKWEEELAKLRAMEIADIGRLYTDLDIKPFIQTQIDKAREEAVQEIIEMVEGTKEKLGGDYGEITNQKQIEEIENHEQAKYNWNNALQTIITKLTQLK